MKIRIDEYSTEWAAAFERERASLALALGELALRIEHIGSTAVPGLAAKPVVDIQIGVADVDAFGAAHGVERVEALDYVHFAQYVAMTPYRRFFARDIAEGVRTHQIHLVPLAHPWWRRHVLFRDYLRSNAEARMRYEDVKRELASREWYSTNDYAMAKTGIVLALEEEAFRAFGLGAEEAAFVRGGRM